MGAKLSSNPTIITGDIYYLLAKSLRSYFKHLELADQYTTNTNNKNNYRL